MLLADLTPGNAARVRSVRGPQAARLSALGFVPGTRVAAEHPAPGGDPAVYSLRGYVVAMRRALARQVEVTQ